MAFVNKLVIRVRVLIMSEPEMSVGPSDGMGLTVNMGPEEKNEPHEPRPVWMKIL